MRAHRAVTHKVQSLPKFVHRDLILSAEIMEMLYEAADDLAYSWRGIRSCGIDDVASEVRVESRRLAGRLLVARRHVDAFAGLLSVRFID